MARMVKVRIRRMGKQWATCGIGLRPPAHMIGIPGIKTRSYKLVPGQVVEIPENHSLLRGNNHDSIEVVTKIAPDEFLRPWVFDTAEAALAADPSLSGMSADQIAAGLSLTEGAQVSQKRKIAERAEAERMANNDRDEAALQAEERRERRAAEKAAAKAAAEEAEEDDEDEIEEPVAEDENARRSHNRVPRVVKEEATPVEDEPAAPTEAPTRQRRRTPR